ncbi:MAG: hypothetical protein H0Z36_01135 [Thermosyntropha sp.]|nr:hypothetical protein [Thermosyntropha sp.]
MLAVLRDIDASPAGDGYNVKNAGNSVHNVPGTAHDEHSVYNSIKAEALEVADYSFHDVN